MAYRDDRDDRAPAGPGRLEVVGGKTCGLPNHLWAKIGESLGARDHLGFAMTCATFRQVQRELSSPPPKTDLTRDELARARPKFTRAWYEWAYREVGRGDRSLATRLCRVAAFQGSRPALEWFRSAGVALDERVCSYAAFGNQLEVLKWLRIDLECPWNERVCNGAAYGGHVDLLRWARAHGCPWSEFTSIHAVSGGEAEVLAYLKENSCPGIDKVETLMDTSDEE